MVDREGSKSLESLSLNDLSHFVDRIHDSPLFWLGSEVVMPDIVPDVIGHDGNLAALANDSPFSFEKPFEPALALIG
ncbi:hypothetical protein [Ferrimonas lipolytica]|uniref:Uncharacterized protein n=1 Tax=Ferrimonas lipolytica TaxID=2724191 RepID=A0A6H1UC25_9GAMM|nr:hypothetical protein [Ferrimonas lipolytica]QIZ75756.1 hypothetical protein HER31_01875 [Ferrimonas lipolytica]